MILFNNEVKKKKRIFGKKKKGGKTWVCDQKVYLLYYWMFSEMGMPRAKMQQQQQGLWPELKQTEINFNIKMRF